MPAGTRSQVAPACLKSGGGARRTVAVQTPMPIPIRILWASVLMARPMRKATSVEDMQRSRLARQRSVSSWRTMASGMRILPVPDFQVQQRPQEFFVVVPLFQMLGQHAVEGATVVVAGGQRIAAAQVVEEKVPQSAAEPVMDGHTESHLGPLENG